MKVGFITMEKMQNRLLNSVGSSRIRARWLWNNWKGAEQFRVGSKYDVIVFQKAYWPLMLEHFEGVKIFDICDADFLDAAMKYDVMNLINQADAITTSTEMLADYISKFTSKPVRCIADRIELTEHENIKQVHGEKLQHLVWFGYGMNFVYLDKVLQSDITQDLFKKHGLTLTAYSDSEIQLSENCRNIPFEWKKYNYERMHDELIKYDAALFPVGRGDTTVRGRFKSNNKTLTCKALGVPVIHEPKDIERLITQKEREKESKDNLEEIYEKWDVKISVKEFKQLIEEIQNEKENFKNA
jgi:hypothetical protein